MTKLRLSNALVILPLLYGVITVALIGILCIVTPYACYVGADSSFSEATIVVFLGATILGAVIVWILGLPLFYLVRRIAYFRTVTLLIFGSALGLTPLLVPCILGGRCPTTWPIYAVGAIGGLVVAIAFCWVWAPFSVARTDMAR
jgi:hypothetical protein